MNNDCVLYLCTGVAYIPPDVAELSAGDPVTVELDPDLFKIAQEEHGGWSDLMAEVTAYLVGCEMWCTIVCTMYAIP